MEEADPDRFQSGRAANSAMVICPAAKAAVGWAYCWSSSGALEDQEAGCAEDEHADAGVGAARWRGLGRLLGHSRPPGRWATTTSQLVTVGASGLVWAYALARMSMRWA